MGKTSLTTYFAGKASEKQALFYISGENARVQPPRRGTWHDGNSDVTIYTLTHQLHL